VCADGWQIHQCTYGCSQITLAVVVPAIITTKHGAVLLAWYPTPPGLCAVSTAHHLTERVSPTHSGTFNHNEPQPSHIRHGGSSSFTQPSPQPSNKHTLLRPINKVVGIRPEPSCLRQTSSNGTNKRHYAVAAITVAAAGAVLSAAAAAVSAYSKAPLASCSNMSSATTQLWATMGSGSAAYCFSRAMLAASATAPSASAASWRTMACSLVSCVCVTASMQSEHVSNDPVAQWTQAEQSSPFADKGIRSETL